MHDRSLNDQQVRTGETLNERFAGRRLGVATIHGKESVIGPALMKMLPIDGFTAIDGVDTDRFGAFSGEVRRVLDPLETCKAKARHGAHVSGLDLVVASEGSFGPYPPAPFMSCDQEILALYDAHDGTFFEYCHVSLNTVFGGETCTELRQVKAFAERMKFPTHGLVVRTREKWCADDAMKKGITDEAEISEFVTWLIEKYGSCWVETDMRAMMNPTRMRVIGETAERFAQELATLCTFCGSCWFRITQALPGLPCGLCGWPTESIRAHVRTCRVCAYASTSPRPDGKATEEPQYCGNCNP